MTDDQLESLLRETFASREGLAEPDAALAVARSVVAPRRRWPAYVAVAAAVSVIALVGGFLVHAVTADPRIVDVTTGQATRPQTPAASRTYADNRAVALAEAKRVLRLVPLPHDAVDAAPSAWGANGLGMAPSDPTLQQSAVWSVPGDADSVGAYLRSHTLDDARAEDEGGSASDGGPLIPSLQYAVPSPAPDAMIGTTVIVQWQQAGDHTLLRADTFTAARTVRQAESLVPDDVTAVEAFFADPPGRMPRGTPRHLTAAQNRPEIGALVNAVNALSGSIRPVQVISCPGMVDPAPETTLTFHSPDAVLTFHLVDWCLGQVEVQRDGVPLQQTLDPGDLTDITTDILGH